MAMADSSEQTTAPRKRWIIGPVQDLVLFVATPILILPGVLGLGWAGVGSFALNKWVMALGGMGHHLPGMMRAYGDRELFRRFKTRFIFAPLLIGGACVGFSIAGLHTMVLVAYVWGVWHGLMQTHGFLRIYDSKVGSFAKRTARLDFALCVSWFLGGVLFSDTRVDYAQEMVLSCGGPMMTADAVQAVRAVAGAAIGVITLTYLWNIWARRRAGQPPSPVKLLLAVTSVAWWWFANVHVADILIGIILFEIFHDVQYLTIVWLFNRSRVDKDPSVGPFSRMLFRRSKPLLFVYVALVFGYGALGPWSEEKFAGTGVGNIFAGLLVTSALLHFYYDGFIWKVRESNTRANLGIKQDAPQGAAQGSRFPPGLAHAAKWALLAAPVLVLGVLETGGVDPEHARAGLLADLNPTLPSAQLRLGVALKKAGDVDGTLRALDKAHAFDPEDQKAGALLALTLIELGETRLRENRQAEAEEYLHRAYLMDRAFVGRMHDEGRVLLPRDPVEAAWRFRAVLAMKPEGNLGPIWLNLGLALERQGLLMEALPCARTAARLMPRDARARQFVEHLSRLSRGK